MEKCLAMTHESPLVRFVDSGGAANRITPTDLGLIMARATLVTPSGPLGRLTNVIIGSPRGKAPAFETDGAAETKQAREKPGWKNPKKNPGLGRSCGEMGRNGSIDTTRPRFRARKGRSLVFGPALSLLDVLLTELYLLAGCVCRLSAITREPCRSVKQLPGHRLQAAS